MVGIGTSPYNPALARRTLDIACEFLLSAGDLRRIGSAALDLCYIACGRADVYYELQLSPWDFAAGALIVSEAGGRFALPRNGRADELGLWRAGLRAGYQRALLSGGAGRADAAWRVTHRRYNDFAHRMLLSGGNRCVFASYGANVHV